MEFHLFLLLVNSALKKKKLEENFVQINLTKYYFFVRIIELLKRGNEYAFKTIRLSKSSS